MINSFKQREIKTSFQKFQDYSSDVLSSNFHDFNARFKIFIHHCESDEIMKIITSQLKEMNVHFQEWWEKGQKTGGSMVGSKRFDLPLDEGERDALMYQLILKFSTGEINLVQFCLDYFGEDHFDQMIHQFNRAILIPLIRSISHKLREILEAIEEELPEKEDVPIAMLLVYQDHRVTVGSENIFSGDSIIGRGSRIEK